MKKITLSKQQLEYLLVFLARVELKGSEVPIFVEIHNAIHSDMPEE
jgi:hypothetical protein